MAEAEPKRLRRIDRQMQCVNHVLPVPTPPGEVVEGLESAQEIGGRAFALAGIAFEAARDQVAVRVGTKLGAEQ